MVNGRDVVAGRDARTIVTAAAVPVVMLLVAALGTWRVHALDQTSWRGATIGMFASIDSRTNRLVRGIVTGTDRPEQEPFIVLPPPALDEERGRAATTPTPANLRRLADAWAPLVRDGRLVRVEVWATRFRGGPRPQVGMELLGTHELPTAGAP